MPQQPYRSKLAGWGRFPVVDGLMFRSESLPATSERATLSRGLGRSYGDSSLPARPDFPVADTTLADRLLTFDPVSGLLRAEAGASLLDLNRVFLRRGWFVPVSPGTQFVTLGGMAASDVHGKNHHVDGCFGQHVRSVKLRVADGRIIECSDTSEPELFRATLGGMGLTGHILEVEFPMRPIPSPWIWGESERIDDLDRMVAGLKEAARDWPMTVGWVDCLARGAGLGRGILMKGRWARREEAPEEPPPLKRRFCVPFQFPSLALSRPTMKAFNLAYYWKHVQRIRHGILHPEAFFYPLDALDDWNLIYGRRGFTQYQCVLPHADDNGPARRFLELFVSAGGMGFLCVIKDCGAEGKGMLSFPRPGISIALDFPIHRTNTPALVDRLNELVIREGGRIYLTKDTFTRAEHFRAMEPRLEGFNAVRRRWDRRSASAAPVGPAVGRPRMKAVLLGASRGMGRALARLLAARGERLFLLEHVAEDLERSARDLEIRGAQPPVRTAYCDLLQPDSFAPALDQAQRELDGFDTVVVTSGLYTTQEELENDRQLTARLLAADFTNTVLFCEEARKRLLGGHRIPLAPREESPSRRSVTSTLGTLCVFSSVAGERGRKPVILYGAAKAGLSRYLEGLDHKFRARGLRTVCVKPGFVKTGMTVGLKPPPFAGTPEAVARRVLRAIDRGWPEVYVPWQWRGVMCVIRNLPRTVMRKIEF